MMEGLKRLKRRPHSFQPKVSIAFEKNILFIFSSESRTCQTVTQACKHEDCCSKLAARSECRFILKQNSKAVS